MRRIKKHKTGNYYELTENNVWVRDINSPVKPLDINSLTSVSDYPRFFENEIANEKNDISAFDATNVRFNNAVLVSDGYGFKEKHKLLTQLPSNVAVIAVNRSLVKWEINRKIDFFIANNPYPECMSLLPQHRYYPRCLVSTRTYPEFVQKYKLRGGSLVSYSSTPEIGYSSPSRTLCQLDDYRNPVCAGINLAYKLGVRNLLLMCCDDSFEGERPGAIHLENDLWTYPPHLTLHYIMQSMLGWYGKNKGVKIGNHSSGPVYEEVPYIHEDEILKFFE